MKYVLLSLCALAGASATAKDHPIVKVIGMLESLKAKAIAQGKEEQVAYEKFTYWCSTSKAELSSAIADEKETISELEDTIAGQKKEIETLEAKIGQLEDEIGDLEASANAAKEDRESEAKLYAKVSKDLDDTIKAMGDCITALKDAETKTESMMLAQRRVKGLIALVSVKATEDQLRTLMNFAADGPGRSGKGDQGDLAKHVDKYDFKSENVVELLKQLKLKFEDEKLEVTKAETNALNAYDLSKAARDNSISAAKKSKEAKEKSNAATKKAKAQAESDLKSTNGDLDADSKSLSTTDESCATKASEWEARSKTRELEIDAMEQAVKILGKSTGVRTEAPGNPIPPASPVDFLQIMSKPVSDKKMKAVTLIRSAAKDAHSRALEALAMEVSTHLNGPFDQVNNMIEKMIFRLMDEQKKEDEHKLWCDEEIKKTNTMKEDKDDKIAELNAEIKEETAAVGKLTEEIADAEKMISDIVAFVKEATEIRNVGKKENAAAIKDAQDAQTSVANAIAVLEAFYKDSGAVKKEPWEFIQKPVKLPEDPKTWDSSYTGVADPKKQPGGIITMLENINADFSKMEAETKSQEQVDQKEFEEAMKANDIEKAGRTQESEMKSAEKARRTEKIADLNSSKKDTSAELEKTEQYLEDLKPACVDGDSKYEDRKAARAKEVEALKKAQVTLQDAFKEKDGFLQIKRH
jgi:uncharacterized coiled-coil protein SlyX